MLGDGVVRHDDAQPCAHDVGARCRATRPTIGGSAREISNTSTPGLMTRGALPTTPGSSSTGSAAAWAAVDRGDAEGDDGHERASNAPLPRGSHQHETATVQDGGARECAPVIAWEESGSGHPLVLVHGLTEHRRAWDRVVPLLEDRFRCIRLDLRGHGASGDAADYSPIAMAEDVAVVVAEADVDAPPVVVGHSLGGVVVTAYAAQAPVARVVSVDQPLRIGDFAAALQPLAGALRGPGFHDVVDTIFGSLGADVLEADDLAFLTELHRTARREVVLGVWDQVLDTPPDELTALAESVFGAIDAPYLAIHGNQPGEDYEAWLRSVLPQAQLEVWGIGGHYPHLADPARFADRLRQLPL